MGRNTKIQARRPIRRQAMIMMIGRNKEKGSGRNKNRRGKSYVREIRVDEDLMIHQIDEAREGKE